MKWIKAKEKMPPEPGMYFVKSNAHGKIILNIEDLDSAKQYLGTGDCEWLCEDEQDEGWVPVAKRLVELRSLHIAPYNLGDMGEIDDLIHKLAKHIPPATK